MLVCTPAQRPLWENRIELDLVNYCNLCCRDCSRGCDRFPNSDALEVAAVARFVDESIAIGKRWERIGLLGGEPTLHPDLVGVFRELRRYHEWFPDADIWMMTNGIVRAAVPNFVHVELNLPHTEHHAFYVSPEDIGKNTKEFCCEGLYCGLGLGTLGYMPCVLGTAMGRIWDVNGALTLSEATEENLMALTPKLCEHCGWRLLDVNDRGKGILHAYPKGFMTLSWSFRFKEWNRRK